MSYTTNFPNAENPLSEGGVWQNLFSDTPVLRTKLKCDVGNCYATDTGATDDSYAYLTGFGTDYTVQGTVLRNASLLAGDTDTHEVELLFRVFDGSLGDVFAYEVDISHTGAVFFVRWAVSGGFDTFFILDNVVTDNPGAMPSPVPDGTVLKGVLQAGVLSLYVNDVLHSHYVLGSDTTNDASPLLTGDPGIGAYFTGPNPSWFGFKSVTISAGSVEVFRTIHPGRGVGMGPRLRRMMNQRYPDVAPPDSGVPATIWKGTDLPDMSGPARRRMPQRFPDTIIPPPSPGAPNVGRGFRRPGGPVGRFRIPQRYPDTVTPPTTINASVGSYTWAGKTSPLSKMINASVGSYTWAGSTSPLSKMINASIGNWTWSGVHATLDGSVTITATPGQYTWSGVPAQIQQIITINAQIGVYSWGGVNAQITSTQVPSKGLAQYGVSFRRKRSQMDEPPDLDVRSALNEVLIKNGLIEKVEYSVSVKPVGETEEIVEVKASGISKRDLQAIVIALLVSDL